MAGTGPARPNNPVSGITICTILFRPRLVAHCGWSGGKRSTIGAGSAGGFSIGAGGLPNGPRPGGGATNLQDLKAGPIGRRYAVASAGHADGRASSPSRGGHGGPVMNVLLYAYGIGEPPHAGVKRRLPAPQAKPGEVPWREGLCSAATLPRWHDWPIGGGYRRVDHRVGPCI